MESDSRPSSGPELVRWFNETEPWGPFPRSIGLEMLEITPERVRGRIPVTDELIAGTGVLWAPVVVGLADALCAAGTGSTRPPESTSFTTLELKTNFLGTARVGEEIVGIATPAHLGRTTQVWDVTVTNESTGKAIALFRSTQMILYAS
jgi:uncharacterized protein (TIGR00369 family)